MTFNDGSNLQRMAAHLPLTRYVFYPQYRFSFYESPPIVRLLYCQADNLPRQTLFVCP
jgi:hypothetical protein